MSADRSDASKRIGRLATRAPRATTLTRRSSPAAPRRRVQGGATTSNPSASGGSIRRPVRDQQAARGDDTPVAHQRRGGQDDHGVRPVDHRRPDRLVPHDHRARRGPATHLRPVARDPQDLASLDFAACGQDLAGEQDPLAAESRDDDGALHRSARRRCGRGRPDGCLRRCAGGLRPVDEDARRVDRRDGLAEVFDRLHAGSSPSPTGQFDRISTIANPAPASCASQARAGTPSCLPDRRRDPRSTRARRRPRRAAARASR